MLFRLFKIVIFIVFCITKGTGIYAQIIEKPDIVPPSPQAQQFAKYIDYPVDYSTGIPKTEIPIYTINCGKLTIPLSISYHSSGLKLRDKTGIIGLGWTLNYGGMISRSMHGSADELHYDETIPMDSEILSTSSPNAPDSDPYYGVLSATENGDFDPEYDVFHYTIPNQAGGKFIFEKTGDISSFSNPIQLPAKPTIKITPYLESSSGIYSITHFDVYDENGNYYRYGRGIDSNEDELEYIRNHTRTTAFWATSGWLLTDIVSSDGSDHITFEYEDILNSGSIWKVESHNIYTKYYTDFIKGSPLNSCGWPTTDSYGENVINQAYSYTQKRIKTIRFNNNEVRFSYKGDSFSNSLLSKVQVYDAENTTLIKTIGFEQSPYHSQSNRLNWDKLDAVKYYDGSGIYLEKKYVFNYNTSKEFPLDSRNAFDHWGYYNGANGISSRIPNNIPEPFSNILRGNANRDPNPEYTQTGILETIIYPTGGTAVFTYEGNKIDNVTVGGIRVKQIKLQDGGNILVKTFDYNNGIGVKDISPLYYLKRSMTRYNNDINCLTVITATHRSSSDVNVNINLNGAPVKYLKVAEYYGDLINNNGSIEHTYNPEALNPSLFPYYSYTSSSYPTWMNFANLSAMQPVDYYIKYPYCIYLNETKTIWKNSKSEVLKEVNKYYTNSLKKSYNGLHLRRHATDYWGYKTAYFAYSTYSMQQYAQLLDSVVTKLYHPKSEGIIVSKEEFLYNEFLLPSCKSKTDSKGRTNRVYLRYPFDISASPYKEMTSANILNRPIEQTKVLNNLVTDGVLTTYKEDNTKYVPSSEYRLNIIDPFAYSSYSSFSGENKDSHYNNIEEISFDKYDINGNICQKTNIDGIVTSYIWDKSGQYLMAQLTGTAINYNESINCSQSSIDFYDNLSIQYPNALISTYSYNHLIGIKSQTKPDGTTVYYDYDNFDRLDCVRNNDQNIVSKYDYYYTTTEFLTPHPTGLVRTSSSPGNSILSLSSNCSWSVYRYPSWIYIGTTTGTNNGEITVGFTANTSGQIREGEILIYYGSGSSVLSIPVLQVGNN